MDSNTSCRQNGVAQTACAALLLSCSLACTSSPAEVSGNTQPLAGGGQGGTSAGAGNGGAAGSAGEDASVSGIKLDVEPGWWGPADAPKGPEVFTPTGDSNCGALASKTTRLPADVLLVLDRSDSMGWSITEDCYCTATGGRGVGTTVCTNTTNCTSRWDALKPAITDTLSKAAYVNWGLKFFPSPDNSATCNENTTIEVKITATSATTVASQVSSATSSLGTPTTVALKAATDYLKTLNDGNKKFILLATDGQPNCGGTPVNINTTDVQGAADACAAAAAAGFPVYVVGIGPDLGVLTQLAKSGGTTDYYPVSSPQDLADALSKISSFVGSCSVKSDQPPPDPDNVAVYVNGKKVEKDPNNGWTFGADPQEIVLTGDQCKLMSSGDPVDVQILFGCPGQKEFPTDIY
jgi:hypothetical protein